MSLVTLFPNWRQMLLEQLRKKLFFVCKHTFVAGIILLLSSDLAFAATQTSSELVSFVSNTSQILITFGALVATLFLVKGGYEYITSTGKPDALEQAKKTIKNSIIGLILVIGASVISLFISKTFHASTATPTNITTEISVIEPTEPEPGLTQILLDAMSGLIKTIVQSAVTPITDGLISFLTSTPSVIGNSVVFDYWIKMTGFVSVLYILMIALLGFHVMSASQFGFAEIDLRHLLPRIGLSFLLSNMSIFLIEWVILLCNVLVRAILISSGGLQSAWITNAFDPLAIVTGASSFITLIFMLLFVILAVVLLLFYIIRLIVISLGAVLSPLIFLLWLLPKFTDFAEIAIKTYLIQIFTILVHVITIQLAASFLTIPEQSGNNPLISILVGIALLFTLLKTPQAMMQFAFYTSFSGVMRSLSGKVMNVMHTQNTKSVVVENSYAPKITKRKVISG